MQIITPPTDNLYKFVAIAGLVIFVASFVVPKQVEYMLRDKKFQKISEEAKAKADYEIWLGAEKRLEIQKKQLEADNRAFHEFMVENPRDSIPDDVAQVLKEKSLEADKRRMEFWKEHEKNAQLAGIADQDIGLIKALEEEITFLESESKWARCVAGWCFWISIGMLGCGFFFWWSKVQIPQDETTILELAEKRLTLAKVEKDNGNKSQWVGSM